MVNNKDFGKRIQKIMDYYAVSASSFADYMGVGRSSISHILSGRNKPSLDFVMKIVDAYTDVDLEWLLYGKGTFPRSKNTIQEKTDVQEIEAISKATSTPTISSEQDLFSQSATREKEIVEQSISSVEKISQVHSSEHAIDRIVIFYSDGTFNSYEMKKS